MIDRKDIDKLVAKVAEKSIQTVSGSNIKIQSGIINLEDGGVDFNEPFDAPPVIVLTPSVGSYGADVGIWLVDSSATGFVIDGYAQALDPVSVMWLAIGQKI